jgi:cytoskeleton protein RodZ
LTFLFEKDCWVEVKDSNDKLLFSGLKHAEDNLTINGLAPFSILLGYAPGVTLSHNGKLVDIDVNSKNNSARLVVDRS